MSVVIDALEAAAGAGYDFGGIGKRQSISRRRTDDARRVVQRFLESLPEDMTVLDILHRLDGSVDD